MEYEAFEWSKHHMSECDFTWHRPPEIGNVEIKVRRNMDQSLDTTLTREGRSSDLHDLAEWNGKVIPYVQQYSSIGISVEIDVITIKS